MSGGLEAVGETVSGALAGRVVEPAHGEAADGAHHGACLNCGVSLQGAYCHHCGQNSHLHRSLAGFGHDLLHGVFHFEGKIWRTLPMLLFRPGELTRRYIHGERARFVSPLAMFLFCMFLLFAVVGGLAGEMRAPEVSVANRAKSLDQVTAELKARRAERDAITGQMQAMPTAGKDSPAYDALDARRDKVDEDIDGLELALNMLKPQAKGSDFKVFGGLHTGWASLDHGLEKANENPNLFLYKLQTSAYKYSWALIPISTPLVWLLFFWKRQYKLYDHLVFVTYSLTFMSLLVVTLTLLGYLGLPSAAISLAGMLLPPVHAYRQMKGAYLTSRAGALLRTAILMIEGCIAIVLFVMLLLALGLMH